MKEPFEIEWLGGPAERHYRKLRPMAPDIPWGTLNPQKYPAALVDRARVTWTRIARSEYRAAAAFAQVQSALLAAKTPLDLVGMAADFIADELFHVELASRLAMEIGGGAPIDADFSRMEFETATDLTPRQRANELVLRVCCVYETMSGAIALETMREVEHPLVTKIMTRIARDEARHKRLGWIYMEWVAEDMDDAERARLGAIADGEIANLSPIWMRRTSKVKDGVTSEGYRLQDIHELGWMESQHMAEVAIRAVHDEVAAPLAKLGIAVPLEHPSLVPLRDKEPTARRRRGSSP